MLKILNPGRGARSNGVKNKGIITLSGYWKFLKTWIYCPALHHSSRILFFFQWCHPEHSYKVLTKTQTNHLIRKVACFPWIFDVLIAINLLKQSRKISKHKSFCGLGRPDLPLCSWVWGPRGSGFVNTMGDQPGVGLP